MHKDLDEIEFTIFDTETTGLELASGDRIVEIAGIRLKGKEKLATFESLINPGRPISEAAFQVNHISPQMLKNAPQPKEILPKFLDFIKGSHLCSYNAGFDLEFLNYELRIIGRQMDEDIIVIDILKMAKRLLPDMERYALWFTAHKLGIEVQQIHRALSDVEITWQIFNKLKKKLKEKQIFDFMNFSGLFGINGRFLRDLNNQKITQIQEALDLGVKLKIRYLASSSAEVSEREVIPRKIQQDNGKVYLVGYCCLRNEERSFRIDGILHLEIL